MDDDSDKKVEEETSGTTNTRLLDRYNEYAPENRFVAPLEARDLTGVRLLRVLKSKKAALNSYNELFEWHLREIGALKEGDGMRSAENRRLYIGREPLIKMLASRYGLTGMEPVVKTVTLPSSKEVVKIPCNKAEDCMLQLLTDPRITDDHYHFFNDDPNAPPPEDLDYVADIPTGDAFLDTYNVLCKGRKKQLLGVIFYIDAAVTGQFAALPVLILKMSLTIFTREARKKDYCWANLAYLPHLQVAEGRGKKLFKESHHLEAQDIEHFAAGEGGKVEGDDQSDDSSTDEEGPPPIKAQDFHKMLAVGLESYVELQESGLAWRHRYKKTTWPLTDYELFTPIIKCDTEEADTLSAKYLPKTSNINQLCRYCLCPTKETDKWSLRYNFKTKPMIEKLIKKGELENLKNISQHYLTNAFYKIRFNLGNDRSIHGATPFEKLHHIDLGIFPRVRNVFFEMIGKTGELQLSVNGLASVYGKIFAHQSDRTMPPTNFGNGIKEGKLMAREYKGVILILAAVLMSTGGRDLLQHKRKFKQDAQKDDWLMLMELLLQWEAFLNEPKMDRSVVVRLKRKHKYIMYCIKRVAKRTEGMGMRFVKFHGILHMMEDILLYGVPMELDTGANESHHKMAKQAARVTQRSRSSFDTQVAQRLFEYMVLDLAWEEIQTGRVNWRYYNDFEKNDRWEDLSDESLCLDDSELTQSLQGMDISGQSVGQSAISEAPFSVQSDPSTINASNSGESMGSSKTPTTTSVASTTRQGNETLPDEEEQPQPDVEQPNEDAPMASKVVHATGGARIEVWTDDDLVNQFQILTRGKHQNQTSMTTQLIDFLVDLQNFVYDYIPSGELQIFTKHTRYTQDWSYIFHAHPNFRGQGTWKDWAIFDWGPEGNLPCHIHCFVDLTDYQGPRRRLIFGGIKLEATTYAVIESSTYEEPDQEKREAELFAPLTKDVKSIHEERVVERLFYLADVNSIKDVACVIPDIGGPPNRYFFVHPRPYWSKLFEKWVKAPHKDDEMSEEEISDEESWKNRRKKRKGKAKK